MPGYNHSGTHKTGGVERDDWNRAGTFRGRGA